MSAQATRILVTAFGPVPGSGPHASALFGMVTALRGEVDMVTLKTDALPHLSRIGEARMFRVPVSGDSRQQQRAFARAVVRQVESETYDAVHVRGAIEGQALLPLADALDFFFVYEVATFPDESDPLDLKMDWERAHHACLNRADAILVPSTAAAKSAVEMGFGDKVRVVFPGVDLYRFDWQTRPQTENARLLYLGSFAADRDLSTLLRVVRALRERYPLEVLIAGDTDPVRHRRLKAMVSYYDLVNTVRVKGEPRPSSLAALIGATDVCLTTAAISPRFGTYGDLPEPLLEYLACRKPVVAAHVPALLDVVENGTHALLYEPGNESSLKHAIERLLTDAELRNRLAESGYERIRALYSDGARRRRIAEIYESLLPNVHTVDAFADPFLDSGEAGTSVPTGMHEENLEETPGEATSIRPPAPGEMDDWAAVPSDALLVPNLTASMESVAMHSGIDGATDPAMVVPDELDETRATLEMVVEETFEGERSPTDQQRPLSSDAAVAVLKRLTTDEAEETEP